MRVAFLLLLKADKKLEDMRKKYTNIPTIKFNQFNISLVKSRVRISSSSSS